MVEGQIVRRLVLAIKGHGGQYSHTALKLVWVVLCKKCVINFYCMDMFFLAFLAGASYLVNYYHNYETDRIVNLLSGTFPAPSARLGVPSPPATSVLRLVPAPELPDAAGRTTFPAVATVAPLPPSGASWRFCWQVLKTARHEANVAVQLYRSTTQSR